MNRTVDECIELSWVDQHADLPVHGVDLRDGEWWACEHPERPVSNGVFWDEKCRACCIAYTAARAQSPTFGVWFLGELRPLSAVALEDGAWRLV